VNKAGLLVGAVAMSPLVMIAPIVIALSGSASARCQSGQTNADAASVTQLVQQILAGQTGNIHVAELHDPAKQIPNAQTIVATGIALHVPPRGQIAALATAMQESKLVNLPYGDLDSVGLFQQRASMGWGTIAQIMDPVYSATKFYTALKSVRGWEQMTIGQASQAVQKSNFPDLYDQWIPIATALQQAVTSVLPAGQGPLVPQDAPTTGPSDVPGPLPSVGITVAPGTAPDPGLTAPPVTSVSGAGLAGCRTTGLGPAGDGADGSGFGSIPPGALPEGYQIPADSPRAVQTAIRWALGQLGTGYQWGGTCEAPRGPDPMGRCDCSSLMQRAYAAAGVPLTRTTYTQVNEGVPVTLADLRPGDLVFTRGTAAVPEHVGMVIGSGLIVNAPKTGDVVRIATLADWKKQILAARRVTG
jgi:cell wall-associated NlpC family hydrolase